MNHEVFASYINPLHQALRHGVVLGVYHLETVKGLSALDCEVTRQAATLAYLQAFRLMMWVSLCAIPLVLLLLSPKRGNGTRSEAPVLE